MTFTSILESHVALSKRRANSHAQLERVKNEANKESYLNDASLAVFCAGSLARLEAGEKSDLDLFVTANDDPKLRSRLFEYTLFGHLISINEKLEFPPLVTMVSILKFIF